MAYINQAKKAELMPGIKAVLKKYGMRGSVSVRDYAVLTVKVSAGPIDFEKHHIGGFEQNFCDFQESKYNLDRIWKGRALGFFHEMFRAMSRGNHDNSNPMIDYFDVGWYAYVNIGSYDNPYKVNE